MKKNSLILILILLSFGCFSQKDHLLVKINVNEIQNKLKSVPVELSIASSKQQAIAAGIAINLPLPNGSEGKYTVVESPLMSPELAKKFPEIKTYRVFGKNSANGLITVAPSGVYGLILETEGSVVIAPKNILQNEHEVFYQEASAKNFECKEIGLDSEQLDKKLKVNGIQSYSNGATLRTYRMAIVTTGEFYTANGATESSAQAAVVSIVNSLRAVYEKEVSISFTLVATKIYTDATTDPFSRGENAEDAALAFGSLMSNEPANFALSNYDIGHVLNNQLGGGEAYTYSVCKNGNLATNPSPHKSGAWSNSTPTSFDTFIHEVGHQFGAEHTFNSDSGGCNGNINITDAYEPGSGSTYMSYWGLCNNDNISGIVNNTYFHTRSIQSILNYSATEATCSINSSTGNTPPVVVANPTSKTLVIPRGTPFILEGSGTDVNGHTILYNWEQYNIGTTRGGADDAQNSTDSPIFRSVAPSAFGNVRMFPTLSTILEGNLPNNDEALPQVARIITMRLTGRDNNATGGGIHCASIDITVANSAPFKISSFNTSSVWQYSGNDADKVLLTWDVSSTNQAPINCTDVKITFSTDGGLTFPITILASTPNDGSELINVPSNLTTTGRIKVEAIGNIFFDINDRNIIISNTCIKETTSVILPDTEILATVGSDTLKMNGTAYFDLLFPASIQITATDPSVNLTVTNTTNSSCVNFPERPKYKKYEFKVTATGNYTFTFSGSTIATPVMNLYKSRFNSDEPCTNWLMSSGTLTNRIVTAGSTMTYNLTANVTYILVVSGYNDNDTGTCTVTCTNSVSGEVRYAEQKTSFKYLVVNSSSTIIGFLDNTNLLAYPLGQYKLYVFSYADNLVLSNYINTNFTTFQNLINNNTICGKLSNNYRQVSIYLTPDFKISSFNTSSVWQYSGNGTDKVLLTWDVSNTNQTPLNCTDVKITFSTDGGLTFPITILASTPNDGSELINIPSSLTTTGRIKIETIGKIFFDVNDRNITISNTCIKEISSIITPDEAVLEFAGSDALNISSTPYFSLFPISVQITAADPSTTLIAVNTSNSACSQFAERPKYKKYEFRVTTTGNYTFTFSGSTIATPVMNLYQNTFTSTEPCTNWLMSSGTLTNGRVTTGSTMTYNLTANVTYILVVSGYNNNDTGTCTVTCTNSVSGEVRFAEPKTSFKYLVINSNNIITGFLDNINLKSYPLGFYKVYLFSYTDNMVLSDYTNTNFANFQNLISNNIICGTLSSNYREITIQSILYVKQGGTGRGTSWADASGNLQAMIDSNFTHQVWVAAGIYKPTTGSDRTKSFKMKAGVKIYGGFPAMGNPTFTDRNWSINKTILTGDLLGNDNIAGTGNTLSITNNSENSYVVISNNDNGLTSSNSLLDGFIISGGNANGTNTNNIGGGMFNYNVSPKVVNTIFFGNYAGSGGGVFNNFSFPNFQNIVFLRNRAAISGGGICEAFQSKSTITNSTFFGNSTSLGGVGGGLFVSNNSSSIVHNSIFWGNSTPNIGPDISVSLGGNISLDYSLVQSQSTQYTTGYVLGNGMLYGIDPLFFDEPNFDLRLQSKSCAVNAGFNQYVPDWAKLDMQSMLRIYNNGTGTVDLGAYEFQGEKQTYTLPSLTSNNALKFDGVNDHVNITTYNFINCSSSTLNFSDAITIEYWFKGTNPQSAVRFQNGQNYIVSGWGTAGNFKHILSNSGGTNGVAVGAAATDGNWHHIAVTWQKGATNGFKSYLDGQLVEQRDAANTNLPSFNGGMFLGSFSGTAEFTNGSLDEVRVWNVLRSQADIRANLNNELSLPQTGLLMYYKFNHGTPSATNSSSTQLLNSAYPNEFMGTLNGFSLEGNSSNWVEPAAYPIRYVKAGGSGIGNSWANASGDLQAMINAFGVQQVWVAAGTYYPDEGVGRIDNDRNASFSMKNGVSILGGFPAAGSPALTLRNPMSNPTILSGDIDKNNILDNNNAFHVISNQPGLTSTAVLDGFVVTNGNANATGSSDNRYGGGVLNISFGSVCSPIFRNSIFKENTAVAGGAMFNSGYGGACSPQLTNCIFQGNSANSGGGIFASFSSTQLTNCTIQGNAAVTSGGAMYINNSSLQLTNCIVYGNGNGQSIYTYFGQINANNCLFETGISDIPNESYNLYGDPLFVNAVNGDLRLTAQSCAINAGLNSVIPTSLVTDLAGNPRIYNNGTVDIGAYEYQAEKEPYLPPVIPITSNNALSFDGINDYISSSSLDLTNCTTTAFNFSDALTIEYWFKGTNPQAAVSFLQNDEYIITGWGTAGNFNHILTYIGGGAVIAMGASVTDGNWHHVAVTWQKGATNGFKSYLDGQLVEQKNAANASLHSFNNGMFIGSLDGTKNFTNGTLDEVRVWNVARSQAEIQANMCALNLPQNGLILNYKFNHGTANSSNTASNQLLNSASTSTFIGVLNNFALTGSNSNWVETNTECTVNFPNISLSGFTKNSFCAGSSFNLTFTSTGNFNAGNVFQVILSDSNGDFTAGQVIGTGSTVGSIACTIPSNMVFSENYRIKVISTFPRIGDDISLNNLTIHSKDLTLASPTNNFSTGNPIVKATDTITATNTNTGNANVSYQAGKSVLLSPGFQASNGVIFKAEIRACEN